MKIRAFITHKLREHYSECQDRFCINSDSRAIAVSDGMSQSVFPDYWAEILSSFYAKNGHCTNEDRKELCGVWLKKVEDFINAEIYNGKNPWRLQNCIDAQNGAGATLCGIRFIDTENWVGHVLGDTCIIDVDITGKAPIKIYTSEDKAFDSYPDYYESFPNKVGRGQIKEFTGKLSEGHCLLLVSDPFSEFLSNHKEHCSQWLRRILELKGHEDYCSLVDDWRHEGLHNDDRTLCIIEPDGSLNFNIEQEDDITMFIKKELFPINEISKEPISHENSAIIMELDDKENKDVNAFPMQEVAETPESFSLRDKIQRIKMDGKKKANDCCESVIDNAKRSCLSRVKKKKQKVKPAYIGDDEIRNLCKEIVDFYEEAMDSLLESK